MGELYSLDLTIEIDADNPIDAMDKLKGLFNYEKDVDVLLTPEVESRLFGELGIDYD